MFQGDQINKDTDQLQNVKQWRGGVSGGGVSGGGAVCLERGLWKCAPRSTLTINTQLSESAMWNCGDSTWGSGANDIYICPHLQHQHPQLCPAPSPSSHPWLPLFAACHLICKSDTCLFLPEERRRGDKRRREERKGEEEVMVRDVGLKLLRQQPRCSCLRSCSVSSEVDDQAASGRARPPQDTSLWGVWGPLSPPDWKRPSSPSSDQVAAFSK